MTTRLLIFDDCRGDLGPLADLRAAFDVRTGRINNRVRIETSLGVTATDLVVHPRLAALRRLAETDALCNAPLKRTSTIRFHQRSGSGPWTPTSAAGDAELLMVNGRWPGWSPAQVASVKSLRLGEVLLDAEGGLVAARLGCDLAQRLVDQQFQVDASMPAQRLSDRVLLTHPWDVIAQLDATLRFDLSNELHPTLADAPERAAIHVVPGHPIQVAADARVHPMVVLNAEKGPIIIDREAIIGSYGVVAGPCYIGRGTIIGPHSHIRAFTTIGAECVVAGEVSYSVIHDFSNKSHAGYLGHSILGSFVNLGADTNVSNLKNTLGTVRMQLRPGEPARETGLLKLGPVIGDYVRTAIGTRLMTGSCIGTGAMIAVSGFGPKCAAALSFHTDAGVQAGEVEKFLITARAMMARREVEMSAALEGRLRELGRG